MARNRLTRQQVESAREIHQIIRNQGSAEPFNIETDLSDYIATHHNVWRFNGAVKTWKRNPERYYVGIKFGMYEYSNLDSELGSSLYGELFTDADCPLCKHRGFSMGTVKVTRKLDGSIQYK